MKKIISYVFIALFAVFVGWLIFRIVVMESKSVLSEITPTDQAAAVYKDGGEFLTHEPAQTMSFDGYMHLYSLVYLPDAKELQITVKYNKSVYEKLGATAEAGFGFKLYDTLTGEENTDYTFKRDTEDRYSYYRLAFEGVEATDGSDLEIVMFPKGDDTAFTAAKIHKSGQVFEDYKLSEEEIASLGGQTEK